MGLNLSRRQFLGSAAVATSGLLLPPGALKLFASLPKSCSSEISDAGISTNLGLGEIYTGSWRKHLASIEPEFVGMSYAGRAGTTLVGNNELNELTQIKNGFPMSDVLGIPFDDKEQVFLKCLFGFNNNGTGLLAGSCRVEARFIFPGGRNELVVILPKAEIRNFDDLIIFVANNVKADVWSNHPLGRIVFVS